MRCCQGMYVCMKVGSMFHCTLAVDSSSSFLLIDLQDYGEEHAGISIVQEYVKAH